MKKILIIIFTLITSFGFGQTAVKKDNISSGGGSNTVGNTTITYTIGEVVVQENTVGNIHISEGFIGPDFLQPFSVQEYTALEGVSIYPNPVNNELNIQFENDSNYQIIVTNMSGKQLFDINLENRMQHKIDFQNLDKAVYVLIVKDLTNKKYRIFKIIKK